MAAKKTEMVEVPKGAESSKAERPEMTETAQKPVNVDERKPVDDVVYAPKVNVSSAGRISATLEGIAAEFKNLYPDQECRWVFNSVRKPELSNVVSRMTEGYSMIEPSEFKGYPIEPFVDEKGQIRLADVVLMKIPAGQRKVNKEERQRLADAQLNQAKEGFAMSMADVHEGRHKAAVRGGIKMEERDHDLNYEQPDSKVE